MKVRSYVFTTIFLISAVLSSCGHNKITPTDIVAKDTMIFILADFHILESLISLGHSKNKKLEYSSDSLSLGVLEKYQITKIRFDNSYKFYTENPELLDALYVDVISLLSEKQALETK